MADEAERIGGISVEASISDERIDAQLNALLAKMRAAAEQMSSALSITPHVGAPTMAQPMHQQTQAQQTQLTYGRRAAAGAKEYTSLEKAIADALAKEQGALADVGKKVETASRTQQTQFVQQVHASPAADPLKIAISTDDAKKELATFLAEFKTMIEQAQAGATIKINVEGGVPAATSGGGAPRRRTTRGGAPIATEAPPPSSSPRKRATQSRAASAGSAGGYRPSVTTGGVEYFEGDEGYEEALAAYHAKITGAYEKRYGAPPEESDADKRKSAAYVARGLDSRGHPDTYKVFGAGSTTPEEQARATTASDHRMAAAARLDRMRERAGVTEEPPPWADQVPPAAGRPAKGRRRAAAPPGAPPSGTPPGAPPPWAMMGGEEEEEEAPAVRYNRYGAPEMGIVGGGTGVPIRPRRVNRYGVQPIQMIGGTGFGMSVRAQRAKEAEDARARREAEKQARQQAALDAQAARESELQRLSEQQAQNRADTPSSGTFAPQAGAAPAAQTISGGFTLSGPYPGGPSPAAATGRSDQDRAQARRASAASFASRRRAEAAQQRRTEANRPEQLNLGLTTRAGVAQRMAEQAAQRGAQRFDERTEDEFGISEGRGILHTINRRAGSAVDRLFGPRRAREEWLASRAGAAASPAAAAAAPSPGPATAGPTGPRGFTLNGAPFFNGGGGAPPFTPGPTGNNAPPNQPPPPNRPPAGAPPPPNQPPRPQYTSAQRAGSRNRAAEDEASIRQATGGRSQSELAREQRIQANIERQRASITASGRTGRTESFGLGALFGGTQGRFIEASQRQAAALKELNSAQTASEPIRRRLAKYDDDTARAHGPLIGILQREKQAYLSRREVAPIIEREVKATKELEAANAGLQKLQGPTSIARNLLAGAAGGAAFGVAMSGIAEVGKVLGPVLGDIIDQMGGFASKSTGVTTALAQQTQAQKGNVDAVIAQAAVTAGLSGDTADYLSNQLKLTTQVKAGALAQQQTSDLFRAGAGTKQGVPQGLGGGFGGLFGTPFLAQQLGGGKGLQEILAGDVRALGKQTNKTGEFGDVPGTLNDLLGSVNPFGENFGNPGAQIDKRRAAAAQAGPGPELTHELDDLTAAMKRGATATGQQVAATYQFTTSTTEIAKATQIAKAAGDDIGGALASMGYVLKTANGDVADFTTQLQALTQAGIGKGLPAPEELGKLALAQEQQRQREAAASVPALQSQFAYERPAFQAGLERQQNFELNTQIPARAALQNLASPLAAPGTGLVAANAKEQKELEASTKQTGRYQAQLNDYYKQGEQILIDTYQIPPALINDIKSVGAQIVSIQSHIRDEQAAYQVAQYNNQLRIARRTLADIGGLTGHNFGAGQSYLGVLEKQNLALSRQAQLLQFGMQQRQINFQQALAGFQTPGVTPEERQANVKEAKIEADYAQKQLDIQKKMFGNQVQIVDIQNLRQGVDLAAQISLLIQGRQVTFDAAKAEEQLLHLQKIQDANVQRAGTYIEKVDKAVGRAFSEIQALETAAGRAMYNAATYAAGAFGVFLGGTIKDLNKFAASMAAPNSSGSPDDRNNKTNASGYLGTISGATNMIMGEAGTETVAILRNPRAMSGMGGGSVSITFGDVTVRSTEDIDEITRKVTRALGRDASLKGLRNN